MVSDRSEELIAILGSRASDLAHEGRMAIDTEKTDAALMMHAIAHILRRLG